LESNPKYDRTARQSMRKITKRALTGMRTGLFAKSPFRREIRNWPIAAARVADGHGSFRGGGKADTPWLDRAAVIDPTEIARVSRRLVVGAGHACSAAPNRTPIMTPINASYASRCQGSPDLRGRLVLRHGQAFVCCPIDRDRGGRKHRSSDSGCCYQDKFTHFSFSRLNTLTRTLDRRVGSWPDAAIEPVTKRNGEIDPDQIVARILHYHDQ
jgi:hypothetical protein